MYDLIDPKDLSDEELMAKLLKSNQMLMNYRGTQFQGMVDSLESLIGVLGEEAEYRQQMKQEEANKEREKQSAGRYGRKKKSKKKKPNPNVVATLGHIKGVDD